MTWPEIQPDESIPANCFQFRHPDGRIDSFMLIEGEVIATNLTKFDDPPNWSCPLCAFVNKKDDEKCGCCGVDFSR